ncbi:MAG: hypothetical protein K2X29_14165 [Candidatus Obscuribacterales bacterium]|nr:hypothetical protein [Candidatus Obscuribacterales bacterium]
MGRQSSELVGKETAPQSTDSSALSAIGNSPDLVAALKQKTGADEIVADGYFPPKGQGQGYVNRPRTNLDDVRDLQNAQAQCNPPKDVPAPTPTPAPVPVADNGCPTQCNDLRVPNGYQVINQPLVPGQVMKDSDPNNWQDAANQTSSKILSDTINYGNTNAQDSRGKIIQNDRYERETEQYVMNSQHARE